MTQKEKDYKEACYQKEALSNLELQKQADDYFNKEILESMNQKEK